MQKQAPRITPNLRDVRETTRGVGRLCSAVSGSLYLANCAVSQFGKFVAKLKTTTVTTDNRNIEQCTTCASGRNAPEGHGRHDGRDAEQ